MKKYIITIISAIVLGTSAASAACDKVNYKNLPDSIFVGGQTSGHVQGIAYDAKRHCMYLSFTTRFLKIDHDGNIVGSIERVQGHLGSLTVSPVNGKVYASIECIDDEIGQGVAKRLGIAGYTKENSTLYVAEIDVAKLNRIGMDPEKDDVIRTFCVHTAMRDYKSGFHGCAGIDGITFVPKNGVKDPGKKAENWQMCIAYGIYGDVERADNDCQILITYDIPEYEKYLSPMVFGQLHQNGPQECAAKYYIYTGNTRYGVQNMAYDQYTGKLFMAVYKGKKPQYTNPDLFTVDWNPGSFATSYEEAVATGQPLGGWRFKLASTGLFTMGNGYWYISEKIKEKPAKTQACKARLFRWDPQDLKGPFVLSCKYDKK